MTPPGNLPQGTETVGAQFRISDRPAFLSHPTGPIIAVGGNTMIVLLALPYVLRRGLVPFGVRVRFS